MKDGSIQIPGFTYMYKDRIFNDNQRTENDYKKIIKNFNILSEKYNKKYFVISHIFSAYLFNNNVEIIYNNKLLNTEAEKMTSLKKSIEYFINSIKVDNVEIILVKNYSFNLAKYKKCKVKETFNKNFQCSFDYLESKNKHKKINDNSQQ